MSSPAPGSARTGFPSTSWSPKRWLEPVSGEHASDPHGKRVARRAKGLEAALVDRKRMEIVSLERNDDRSVVMSVAGPAALLVAKVHKIAERTGTSDRVRDKDALDVLRLLQATDTATLAARLVDLADDTVSAEVTTEAVSQLEPLFGSPDAVGISMAVRAAPRRRRGGHDFRFVHYARVRPPRRLPV